MLKQPGSLRNRAFFLRGEKMALLRLAVQKSGRLREGSLTLLRESGINFENGRENLLQITAKNFQLQLLFFRDDDIPSYVTDGIVDAGIVGENVLYETGTHTLLRERLGFAHCRVALAVPKHSQISSLESLSGKRIATSYPEILKSFLCEWEIDARIHIISGSVELTPGIGIADAICDIVSSGSTLMANGLREIGTLIESEASLIISSNLDAEKKALLDKLVFRFKAVKRARTCKYILLNAPIEKVDDIASIIPGLKNPTIMPLAQEGWCSLHSVIQEDEFWEKIEQLREAGAQGILVIPIEKMII